MRHSVFGKKLSRTKNERRRLLMGLARDVLKHGHITTTHAKAKAVQPLVEKLITRAKRGKESDRRMALAILVDRKLTGQLMDEAKTRFSNRSSGFTRITRLGRRLGDATETVMLSFVDERIEVEVVKPSKAVSTLTPKRTKSLKLPENSKSPKTKKS